MQQRHASKWIKNKYVHSLMIVDSVIIKLRSYIILKNIKKNSVLIIPLIYSIAHMVYCARLLILIKIYKMNLYIIWIKMNNFILSNIKQSFARLVVIIMIEANVSMHIICKISEEILIIMNMDQRHVNIGIPQILLLIIKRVDAPYS